MEESTTEDNKKTEEKTFTPQEMLKEINKAICTVLAGGQSYQIGTRRLTRADLKQLYEMKNEFEAQVNVESGNELFDNAYVARFEGR